VVHGPGTARELVLANEQRGLPLVASPRWIAPEDRPCPVHEAEVAHARHAHRIFRPQARDLGERRRPRPRLLEEVGKDDPTRGRAASHDADAETTVPKWDGEPGSFFD